MSNTQQKSTSDAAPAGAISHRRQASTRATGALDLGWWRDRDDEAIVRRGILAAIGLPEERLIMALSHTHAGPCTSLLNADLSGGQLIRPYLEALRDACVQAIEEALAQATQAQLIWGLGHCALASNRDLPDARRSRFLTGYNPDAAADDTLLVGRITASDGRILATLVNYACHPTTLAWENTLISPDYIGAMRVGDANLRLANRRCAAGGTAE